MATYQRLCCTAKTVLWECILEASVDVCPRYSKSNNPNNGDATSV